RLAILWNKVGINSAALRQTTLAAVPTGRLCAISAHAAIASLRKITRYGRSKDVDEATAAGIGRLRKGHHLLNLKPTHEDAATLGVAAVSARSPLSASGGTRT